MEERKRNDRWKSGWKSRWLSLFMAVLVALQPAAAVMAESERQSVTEGDGYRVRSNVDGSRTVTFYAETADLEAGGKEKEETEQEEDFVLRKARSAASDVQKLNPQDGAETEMEQEEVSLDTQITGEGEDALVTMEYGAYDLTFTPEIFENVQANAPTPHVSIHTGSGDGAETMPQSAMEGSAPETDGTNKQQPAAEPAPGPESTERQPPAEPAPAPESTEPQTGSSAAEETMTEAQSDPPQTEVMTEEVTEAVTEAGTGVATEEVTEAVTEEVTEAPAGAETEAVTEPESQTETAETESWTEREPQAGSEPETEYESESETENRIPDSELRYTKLPDGIKEELVIYGYRGGHKVSYDFTLHGLTPLREGNAFVLADASGNRIFTVSAPYMYDAVGERSEDIEVSLRETGEDSWEITYTPADAWLAEESRAYPVVVDPTIKTEENTDVEDNYVGDGAEKDHHYNQNNRTLYAGNKDGINYTAFLRPTIPDSLKNISSKVIIQKASVMLYVKEKSGNQNYSFYRVDQSWSSSTITGKNQPDLAASPFYTGKLSKGENTIDLKPLVSDWFNNLDQKENCGLAIKGAGTKGSYVGLGSSDQHTDAELPTRVEFSITYREIDSGKDPGLTLTPHGNEANSGTGYVDVSWKKIPGAEAYYVGIFDGKAYEYFFVGNTTSFTTHGKGLWPTKEEVASGRYALHGDGSGAELPCIPADTYGNVTNGNYKNSLNYYFRIVPANANGQAVKPGMYASVKTVLPDRIQPNQAAAVTVFPASWEKGTTLTVSYSGIQDFNTASAAVTDSLGSGCVQYSIDGTAEFKDTESRNASGSFQISTQGLIDGIHTVYVRGKDSEGNTGTPKGAYFYIDRTGPYGQDVQIVPSTWTNQDRVTLNWSGMEDLSGIGRVEYRIGDGAWIDTGVKQASYAGFPLDIRGLAEGEHTVTLRGTDLLGTVGDTETARIRIDRSGPSGHTLTVLPSGWTNEEEAILSFSGMQDVSGIARTQYRMDDGAWTDTQIASGDCAGYRIQTSQLSDGIHTVRLRGIDRLGIAGPEVQAELKIDRTGPERATVKSDPGSWSREDTAVLSWEGISDAHSQVSRIEYRVLPRQTQAEDIAAEDAAEERRQTDDAAQGSTGAWKETAQVGASGEQELSLLGYSDGTYRVELRAFDTAGNVSETAEAFLYRDTQAPEVQILFPAPESILDGVFSIEGTVIDAHLSSFRLLARDSAGREDLVAEGSENKETEILGSLDLSAYPDGENVSLILQAEDEAGNSSETTSMVIRIGGGMEALEPTLEAVYPKDMKRPQEEGSITGPTSGSGTDGGSTEMVLYIDGMPLEVLEQERFLVDAVRYPEGSLHTLSVLAETAGMIACTPGIGTEQLYEDLWEKGAPVSGGGVWESEVFVTARPMLGLRLDVTDFTPGDSGIYYEYSTDGSTWEMIHPGQDCLFDVPTKEVRLRAFFLPGNAEKSDASPKLYRMDLRAIQEFYPGSFTVHQKSSAGTAVILGPETIDRAKTPLLTSLPAGTKEIYWYLDGVQTSLADGSFDALLTEERTGHRLALLTSGADGQLSSFGGGVSTLLREDLHLTSETQESAVLTCGAPVYALRIKTALRGGQDASFYYAADGGEWEPIPVKEGEGTVFLKEAADSIRLRAVPSEGTRICGWQAEGFTSMEYAVWTELMQAPQAVWASDYGEHDEKRYELSWQETGQTDTTCAYIQTWRVYRDGVCIAETDVPSFTDRDYREGAVYEISAVRQYQPAAEQTEGSVQTEGTAQMSQLYLSRESIRTKAVVTRIQPPPKAELEAEAKNKSKEKRPTANFTLEETTQPQELSSLYGGNRTFVLDEDPPKEERALNQELLGKNKHCSLGFEPVNFNTGNFLLEAEDYRMETSSGPSVALVRTYNAQSWETDGIFGAKWSGEYSQYLQKYRDGTIAYRKADGALVLFAPTEQGYERTEGMTLETENDGYTVRTPEGKTYVFTALGLLQEIRQDGGSITLKRSSTNVLSAIVTQDGTQIGIESDAGGHITRMYLPGGAELVYQYEGSSLISVTDQLGNKTRYVYDSEGRMTEWYDKAGNRQVSNTYDEEGRVTHQIDARDGAYTLAYYEDHTIVTDAAGARSEIWFDEKQRTVKEVDAEGHTYLYSYDEEGNLSAKTDGEGRLTTFEYDEQGRQIQNILPNGAEVTFAYTEDGKLSSQTDANGNETKYEYDTAGNLVKTVFPDGGTELRAYDENGRNITVVDVNGGSTSYQYDSLGNVSEETDPLGNTTKYEYDASGNVTAVTDGCGNRTEKEYDEAGNLLLERKPDGSKIRYSYDSLGNLLSHTDEEGHTTSYTYDALLHCTGTIYPDGTAIQMAYDENGNQISVTDTLGNTSLWEYDKNGNQISGTDPLGRKTAYTYDTNGLMTSMVLPAGGKETYEYDPVTGLLCRTTDAAGKESRFVYDANGNITAQYEGEVLVQSIQYDAMNRPVQFTDAYGNTTKQRYDHAGNLTGITDPLGNETYYEYDACNNLVKETDALGNETVYQYDACGRRIQKTDALGAVTAWEYDACGNLVKETDALGNTTVWTYDRTGKQTGETDALGNTSSTEYDAAGRVRSETGKNGGVTTYTYDAAGNMICEEYPQGGSVSYTYDAAGQQTAMRDVLGKEAVIQYDLSGNICATTDPEGKENRFLYDEAGHLIETVDETGTRTSYTYDSAGRLLSAREGQAALYCSYDEAGNMVSLGDASGEILALSYDADGRQKEVQYPDGSKDTTQYDALGRIIKKQYRDGSYEEYGYDAVGNTVYYDRNGVRTIRRYDLLGRLTKETVEGVPAWYEYDACGRIVAATNAEGQTSRFTYDAEGNMTAHILPDGTALQYSYDNGGRMTESQDAAGSTTQYTYDEADRTASVTDALGGTVSYSYDSYDQISRVTDALGNVTSYTWDARGQLRSETDALGNCFSYEYTEEGWLQCAHDAQGQTTQYEYDPSGSLTGIVYPDGTEVNYTWDSLGNLLGAQGVDGETVYSYNAAGDMTAAANPDGSSVTYRYDAQGNLEAVETFGGRATEYTYDAAGRVETVTGPDGSRTNLKYDQLGRTTEIQTDGTTITYTYDTEGRPLTIKAVGDTELLLEYEYDAAGNMTQETRTEYGVKVTGKYRYDALNRLISWERDDGKSEQYSYDAAGNMTEKTVDGESIRMEYDAANRLTAMCRGSQRITYQYDASGNLVSKTMGDRTDSYTYNSFGLLAEYSGYDGTYVRYRYSSESLLIQKETRGIDGHRTMEELLAGKETEEKETEDEAAEKNEEKGRYEEITSYVYDVTRENAQVLSETVNGTRTEYTYAPGQRLSACQSGSKETVRTDYLYDARGSVVQLLEYKAMAEQAAGGQAEGAAGAQVSGRTSVSYTPYGERMLSGEVAANGFYYNAEAYDEASGSYYLRARYYSPSMMRFGQADAVRGELAVTQSWNRYAYVRNNPVMYADPSGEFLNLIIPAIAVGVVRTAEKIYSSLPAIAGAVAETVLNNKKKQQKTTAQLIQTIKASAGFQVITNALKKSPVGRVLVQLGSSVVKVVTEQQAKAVTEAQKLYDTLKSTDSSTVRELNEKWEKICAQYLGDKLVRDADYYLYGQYGFDDRTIELLKRLRNGINTVYAELSQVERDWMYAQMVGRLQYGNTEQGAIKGAVEWLGVAGPNIAHYTHKETMLIEFGFSEEDYWYLTYMVQLQNKFSSLRKKLNLKNSKKTQIYKQEMELGLGKSLTTDEFEKVWKLYSERMMYTGDYAHSQITTASILNPRAGGVVHWMAMRVSDTDAEGLKDMAGWLGDATLGTPPSFGNDDYIADLDAENITSVMNKKGIGYEAAVSEYQKQIRGGKTRADLFLEDNNYDEVKAEVLRRTGKKNMKQLKKDCPESYNFLKSLENRDHEMKQYAAK